MKAIVQSTYGAPAAVLALQEIATPAIKADEVLVRVRAAAVNALDWHLVRGRPYIARLSGGLRKPKRRVPGVEVAGQVVAVGAHVARFRPGDEVFGVSTGGAFAECVCGREQDLAPKPARLTFVQAAAVTIAGCTALQALRDQGQLRAGQAVLINGAGGGVGTFAVQIATAWGAAVTAVTGPDTLAPVRALGVDRVVDYTRADFTRAGRRYDLIIDLGGNRPLWALRRALTPDGTLVLVGAGQGQWVGPLARPLAAIVLARFGRQRLRAFLAKVTPDDLRALAGLVDAGQVTPVIDRTYPLRETPAAIGYVEGGHARGKVVIAVAP